MSEEIIKPKTREQEAILKGLQRAETGKVVLLYSAGADSTATGFKLVEAGYEVHPLVIDYGQTAAQAEIYLAMTHALALGFEKPSVLQMAHIMSFISNSVLLGGEAINDDDAWVPARNTIFMILGGSYAYQIDADALAVGFMAEDQGVFGDSNLVHHSMVSLLLTQSLSRFMEVLTPLQSMTKQAVLEYLIEVGALEYTTSCWNASVDSEGNITECHECANCLEREKNLQAIQNLSL